MLGITHTPCASPLVSVPRTVARLRTPYHCSPPCRRCLLVPLSVPPRSPPTAAWPRAPQRHLLASAPRTTHPACASPLPTGGCLALGLSMPPPHRRSLHPVCASSLLTGVSLSPAPSMPPHLPSSACPGPRHLGVSTPTLVVASPVAGASLAPVRVADELHAHRCLPASVSSWSFGRSKRWINQAFFLVCIHI